MFNNYQKQTAQFPHAHKKNSTLPSTGATAQVFISGNN